MLASETLKAFSALDSIMYSFNSLDNNIRLAASYTTYYNERLKLAVLEQSQAIGRQNQLGFVRVFSFAVVHGTSSTSRSESVKLPFSSCS